MTCPIITNKRAPQLPGEPWRPGVCSVSVDETLSCNTSDGASSSTCSSVRTSVDWGNNREKRKGQWSGEAGMQETWEPEGQPLSASVQHDSKLLQRSYYGYTQEEEQQQEHLQPCMRQEGQLFLPQPLRGWGEADTMVPGQQRCMQQPALQQEQHERRLVHPSHLLKPVGAPHPLPSHGQNRLQQQQQQPQQGYVQEAYNSRQDLHYGMRDMQQLPQQGHMLHTYVPPPEQRLQGYSDGSYTEQQRPSGNPYVRLTITVMKYRCRHADSRKWQKSEAGSRRSSSPESVKQETSPDSVVQSSSSSSCSSGTSSSSSKCGDSGSGSVSSSILFFGGRRAEKGLQRKNEEGGGCMPLQPFTVTYSAAVPVSLLESLPLFGCIRSEALGIPQRVVLLAFEQEDHVSAENLWLLLDFCHVSYSRPPFAAFSCADATAAADDSHSYDGSSVEAATAAVCSPAGLGIARAAERFVARMSVEQLLQTYAGSLLLLNRLQCQQQQEDSSQKTQEQIQRPTTTASSSQPLLHVQQSLSHPRGQILQHQQQQTVPELGYPQQQQFSYTQQQQQQGPYFYGQIEGGGLKQQQELLSRMQQQQQPRDGVSQGRNVWGGACSAEASNAVTRESKSSGQCTATTVTGAINQQHVGPLIVLQHVRNAGAAKVERLLDEALLPVCCCIAHRYDDLRLLESCYWLLRHILLEKGLPSEWKEPSQQQQQYEGGGTSAAASAVVSVGSETSSEQQKQQQSEAVASAVAAEQRNKGGNSSLQPQQQQVLQWQQQQVFQWQQQQQQVLQWQQQQHQKLPWGSECLKYSQQFGPGQQQQQQLYCPSSVAQGTMQQHFFPQSSFSRTQGSGDVNLNGNVENPTQTKDDSWMPPSVFAHCTGRKACFSIHEATLQHLSYRVPLTVFWKVVAQEVRRKSVFLAEPRGYLHCEIRRLRTPSGNSFAYPHAYFLFADAASCRQLGVQQQLAIKQQQQHCDMVSQCTEEQQELEDSEEHIKKTNTVQQQHEGQVMLLYGRRQSEYSAVDFFLPSSALLEAASHCCFDSEHDGVTDKVTKGRQMLLSAVGAAEVYGKDYAGTLHAGFWGTTFSLKHWGMKQPCKLEGGEGLQSPLAVTCSQEADAPYSFTATAASTPIATASTSENGRSVTALVRSAAPSKKHIYTRLVRVYQQLTDPLPSVHNTGAAPEIATQQLQQLYMLQQQYVRQHQQQHHQYHTPQFQHTLLDQSALHHPATHYSGTPQLPHFPQTYQPYDDPHHHQQLLQQQQQEEQQQRAIDGGGSVDSVSYEEASSVQTSCDVNAFKGLQVGGQQQHEEEIEQQENSSDEEKHLPTKNGVPFFSSCTRSPDEAIPAIGEVAEVLTAEELQRLAEQQKSDNSGGLSNTSGSSTRSTGDLQTNTTATEAAATTAVPSALSTAKGSHGQDDLRPIHVIPHQQETELCIIEFETNLRGELPRHMNVKLLRETGSYNLESVRPRWDETIRAYSLPFFGRAKLPSAKNVQLTPSRGAKSSSNSSGKKKGHSKNRGSSNTRKDEGGHGVSSSVASVAGSAEKDEAEDEEANTSIYLMMGKLSKDVCALDFRAPVRVLEAFAIAAATLAKKRAVS